MLERSDMVVPPDIMVHPDMLVRTPFWYVPTYHRASVLAYQHMAAARRESLSWQVIDPDNH